MVRVVLQIGSAQLLYTLLKLQYCALQLPEEAAIFVPSEKLFDAAAFGWWCAECLIYILSCALKTIFVFWVNPVQWYQMFSLFLLSTEINLTRPRCCNIHLHLKSRYEVWLTNNKFQLNWDYLINNIFEGSFSCVVYQMLQNWAVCLLSTWVRSCLCAWCSSTNVHLRLAPKLIQSP